MSPPADRADGDSLPLVAIVGRPNVGKSTLFNRLLRSRTAITHPTPGVTRDIIEEIANIDDRAIRFADTGGLSKDGDELISRVAARSLEIVARADLILFVVDVTTITPEDQDFAEELIPHRDRVLVVANKVDTESREQLLGECYALGFSDLFPVSAEHGRGIQSLQEAIVNRLPDTADEVKAADGRARPPRVAILGQPNTGKSTLLNTLVGADKALVSDIPGTTRDRISSLVDWRGRELIVVDTAGIRRKTKVQDSLEYYSVNRAIHTIDESDVVLLLIDAPKGLTAQDKKIASLATDRGRGIILVLNKWDLMPRIPNALNAVKDRLTYLFPVLQFAPVVAASATTGDNIDAVVRKTFDVYDELNHRVETGPLNRALARWVETHPPPVGRVGRTKLRYITQVSANPVRFVLFVNRSGLSQEYQSYLRNQIRKEIGFASVPVKIEVRARAIEPRRRFSR